jgi:two-component system CheB/CheR fusion protein
VAKIDDKQYIIAIGASAGGLEAISAFFDYTPLDAVSYIIIQHLSSDFKSQMAHILAPHSKLQVIEAVENVDIKPNTVYLIPSSKFMVVENGRLILSDKKDQPRPHMTIDYFFSSLAKERGSKAIGIILSGTGNDGTKGIEAIKKAGGIAIVQDPNTAGFNGMPLSAIATDCADMILSPEAMPQAIEDYVKDGSLDLFTDNKADRISEKELAQIFTLIKGNLPLDFSDYKRPTIIRRIKRRMVEHNFSKVSKYYQFLKGNTVEINLLANDFLISVTSFFRDPAAFKIIEETVIPEIIKNNDAGVLKIWVAGCATGEEAYSMAILVKEYLNKKPQNIEVKIFASDISKAALDIASKGIYPDTIETTVSGERLKQFFTKVGTTYKVKHEVRKMLIFAQHDLVKNPPYCNIDLISCRNLLIYLNVALQKKVLAMIHFGLKKDGFLFLGPSENAAVLKDDFDAVNVKWNILKSNKTGRAVRFDSFSHQVVEGVKTTTMEVSKKNFAPVSGSALADQINSAVLKESHLTGVCTDENLFVIQSFGDTTAYLRNINFNHNLNDLLPEHISIAFRAAAHKALKLNERVVLNEFHLGSSGNVNGRTVNIVLSPFYVAKSEERLLLVLFLDSKTKNTEKNIINVADISEVTNEHVISLEQEVAELKHSLAVANGRIEASNENSQSFNEELQSANEEMQSANEEMQSTNEELQSVNEELQTVNKDHQMTIGELTDLNDDLNNYFRSNTNGQLFVDQDLLLKRYSPAAVKHINIRESDIGRPLSNITINIKLKTLIEDIKKVISSEETIIREAEALDGRVYQVMTMPYLKKNSKKANGAIISFYDITELKKLLEVLNISNQDLTDSVKAIENSREKVSQLLDKEKELNRLKSHFVTMASHEFKTPLTSIQLSAELIGRVAEQMAHPMLKKYTGTIKNSAKNLVSILNDFLSLELLETGKINPIMSEFDVVMLGKEITEDMQQLAKETQTITFHHTGKNHKVTLNPSLLKNCVINLISNAIKYSGPESLIEFSAKITKSQFTIVISDNGIGIPENDQKHLFEAFFRAHNTGNIPGTGLGLNIVNRYIDLMNGKIKFESKVNKGTIFTITFPVNTKLPAKAEL